MKFVTTTSIEKMNIESERQSGRLANFKITMIAKDASGIQLSDVLKVLALVENPLVTLLELAWDFGPKSGVDGAYVRQHALFGKSKRNQVGVYFGWDSWGSRKGAKFVRSYFKGNLGVHRVELQLNQRWLVHKRHRIHSIHDFRRLVGLLPEHHIFFAQLDEEKLIARLRQNKFSAERVAQILDQLSDHEHDLLATLSYLHRRLNLKNVRRLLIPLPENSLVLGALKKWAAKWPKAPRSAK